MCPTLFKIGRDGPVHLATMSRPRGGDWLADEMRELAAAGVSILVSLLTDSEAAALGLTDEAAEATDAGISFPQLPTPDLHVPDRAAVLGLAAELQFRLAEGASIAIRCRMGIGRSSTLAAAILVLEGIQPADSWQRIASAWGLEVPDTPAQRAFIDNLTAGDDGRDRSALDPMIGTTTPSVLAAASHAGRSRPAIGDDDAVVKPDGEDSVLGASWSLISGDWDWPVHGLRHPPAAGTSGWYIWTGDLSSADDFFRPWHASHLIQRCPDVARYLYLPPGTRFLIAPGHEDIWHDPSLVEPL
jgi:hypothetical protein